MGKLKQLILGTPRSSEVNSYFILARRNFCKSFSDAPCSINIPEELAVFYNYTNFFISDLGDDIDWVLTWLEDKNRESECRGVGQTGLEISDDERFVYISNEIYPEDESLSIRTPHFIELLKKWEKIYQQNSDQYVFTQKGNVFDIYGISDVQPTEKVTTRFLTQLGKLCSHKRVAFIFDCQGTLGLGVEDGTTLLVYGRWSIYGTDRLEEFINKHVVSAIETDSLAMLIFENDLKIEIDLTTQFENYSEIMRLDVVGEKHISWY